MSDPVAVVFVVKIYQEKNKRMKENMKEDRSQHEEKVRKEGETRPNWARKVREMILFSVLCTVYCGRGCVSLESEYGKELA